LRGSSSTTSPTPRVRVPRHVARLVVRLVVDYSSTLRVRVTRHLARLVAWLIVDYFSHAAHPGASASRAAHRRLLRLARLIVDYFAYAVRTGALARRAARRRLLLPRRASGSLGTSHGSSSTTSPRTARHRLLRLRRAYGCLGTSCGSSSTTSPTPRVRVPRHVARLIVDYFASHSSSSTTSPTSCVRVPQHVERLVVDFFAHAARSSASARHIACRTARRRKLRLCCAFECHSTSRGSSSTTSPTPRVWVPRHVARLVIDFFAHAARPGASAPHVACRTARRRLLHLCRASECLRTSCGSSSTTSPMPRVRVTRHIVWLVVDYFSHAARPGASACHAARHRLLRLARAHRQLLRLARLVVDYFAYAARPSASACRVAHRRQLRPHCVSG
jgi:hypothetical protein